MSKNLSKKQKKHTYRDFHRGVEGSERLKKTQKSEIEGDVATKTIKESIKSFDIAL